MQFNSLTFVAFFLAVYLIYRIAPRHLQNLILLMASYVFYIWWDVRFLFLILLSTALNYCCGILFRDGVIHHKQRITFSIWLIAAGFFTIVIQWNQLPDFQNLFAAGPDWRAIIGSAQSWKIFSALAITVLFLNLFYHLITELTEQKKKQLFLFLGVSGNLIILGFFKYFNFFAENIALLLSGLDLDPSRFHLNIILPIGISFYTFKGISYVVDAYRNQISIKYTFIDFSLFMAFFPSILAGPIDRASSFFHQVCEKRYLNWDQSIRGIHLFILGFFKKVVIADGVVRTVASVFDSTGQASWIDVIIATLLFTIQIYCDFSGYTDMARGTAKLFGIDLMINFRLPYFSRSPREFWNRWHISLSSWLRDYLYISLGGNRHGKIKTYCNLIITMVLGGLWHGAAWNFVLWGLYHGVALSIHRAFTSIRTAAHDHSTVLFDIAKMVLCFVVISYGWLLFRAPSFERIIDLTTTLIFDFGNLHYGIAWPRLAALAGLPILFIIEFIEKTGNEKPFYEKIPVPAWTALYAAIIFSIAIGMTTESTQFIYMVF